MKKTRSNLTGPIISVPLPRRIDPPLACSSAPWRPRTNSKYEEYDFVRARAPRSRSPARSTDQYVSGAALGGVLGSSWIISITWRTLRKGRLYGGRQCDQSWL